MRYDLWYVQDLTRAFCVLLKNCLTSPDLRERMVNDGAVRPLVQLLHKTEIRGAQRSPAVVAAAASAVWNISAHESAKAAASRLAPVARLQPRASGLQPRASGLQPHASGLQPRASGLQPRASGPPPPCIRAATPMHPGRHPRHPGCLPMHPGRHPAHPRRS